MCIQSVGNERLGSHSDGYHRPEPSGKNAHVQDDVMLDQ